MYLANLKLWNFRKFGSDGDIYNDSPDLNVDFHEGLNLLIGENDSGKTAIIDAIKMVLKTSSNDWIRLDEDDFYKESQELRIELLLSGFSDNEASHFTEYLTTKFVEGKPEHKLRLIFTATRADNKIKTKDIRAGEDAGHVVLAEARDYLKSTYLKPLRDARSELIPKRNSRLSQIFSEHEAFKSHESHLLLKVYNEFNETIEAYFDGKNRDGEILIEDQNGKSLKSSIDGTISQFFEASTTSTLKTASAQMKKVLESLELSLVDVENPGLGSLNRLFMASELIHLNKNDWSGLKLGLVEEIEAHLHPQVQLKVIKSLLSLEKTQLLLTTHSPNLASQVPLMNQIICRNNNAFPMGSKYTNLSENQYVFLDKFLDVTRSSLFFARGLILVEGWSEELLIPIIADRIGYNLIDHEVTVINVSNLGFENYHKIFSRTDDKDMGIKISVITDCDFAAYEELIVDSEKVYYEVDKKEYLEGCENAAKMIEEKYNGVVQAYVAREWTLEWCLMKSKVLGNLFLEVAKTVHTKGAWITEPEKQLAEKLLKKTLNKSEIAYQMDKKLNDDKQNLDLSKLKNDPSMKHIFEAIKNACTR